MKEWVLPRALQHLGLTLCVWIGIRVTFETIVVQGRLMESEHPNDVTSHPEFPVTGALIQAAIPEIPPAGHKAGRGSRGRRPGWGSAQIIHAPEQVALGGAVMRDPALESRAMPAAKEPSASVQTTQVSKQGSWSLSAWAVVRPDAGPVGLSPNGQLGGSQFGFRIQRRLVEPVASVTVAANMRVSTPLRQPKGKEAGLGLAIRRSGAVPIELIAERRIGLDRGGRDAFAGLVATGIDDVPLPAGLRLSGYAQTGIVGARKRDGFADGSLRVEHDVGAIRGIALRLGGAASGAIQPGVSRLDLGPSVAARFRLGKANLRLAGEWRERVAGSARPGSGPALVLGLDY